MLIQPVVAQKPPKKTNDWHFKSKYGQAIVHWVFMFFIWAAMLASIYLIKAVRSGTWFQINNGNNLRASAVFTLSFFIVIYVIGITLFLISEMILNGLNKIHYSFFINLNGIIVITFLFFWILTFTLF